MALVVAAAIPLPAAAQDETYARLSVTAAQVFDGNVNAAPAPAVAADFISRITPAIDAGYRSMPFSLQSRYSIDADRFLNHVDLSRAVARQQADVTTRYAPTRRVAIDSGASYVVTQNPVELNLDSLIRIGRARAARLAANTDVTYNWSPLAALTGGLAWSTDRLEGAAATTTRTATLRAERRAWRRMSHRVGYRVRHIDFGSGAAETSHLLTGGLVHALTHSTSVGVEAGPYVTRERIRPEVSATLRHQLRLGELSLGYARTYMTAIGLPGPVEISRLSGAGTYRPRRGMVFTLVPALARNLHGGGRASVVTLDAQASLPCGRGLSLVAVSRVGRQTGTLSSVDQDIPLRLFSLSLSAAFPR